MANDDIKFTQEELDSIGELQNRGMPTLYLVGLSFGGSSR